MTDFIPEYSQAIPLQMNVRQGVYCGWDNVNCEHIEFTYTISEEEAAVTELGFIIDDFPQDGQHLMDIYATTNPPNSGSYYWRTSEWTYTDLTESQDREVLVIPYGRACSQIDFRATECVLYIDLNVTGSDVYNVVLTNEYTPEVCQAEPACADMFWSTEQKRCCLRAAYLSSELGEACSDQLERQLLVNPSSILGPDSHCAVVSEKRKELAKMLVGRGAGRGGGGMAGESLTQSLLWEDAKMDMRLGGLVPENVHLSIAPGPADAPAVEMQEGVGCRGVGEEDL